MKKQMALLLLACVLLAAVTAAAEEVFCGNMEVVRCKEWVSLREKPDASSRRLTKVPLGAVVNNCLRCGEGWIYGAYGGCEGYIQAKYLQQCEGVSVCSAMLITGSPGGAALYAKAGSTEPVDMLPANTLLRDCAVMASGRAYVTCGSRTGYVSAEQVTPYGELTQLPAQFALHCSLYGRADEFPAPALMAAYAADFPLDAYACSEFDYTRRQPADADAPAAAFVLYTDSPVKNVQLFSVSLRDMDVETGEAVYDFVPEFVLPRLDPDHPLSVRAVFYGDTPNLAVGYEDWTGAYRFALLEISGEDGSLRLREV